MSEAVGGTMTLAALDLLAANAATELIVVIGKPPAPAVGERIRAKLAGIGKPVVVCLLGRDVIVGREGPVTTVATLADAALAAHAVLAGTAWQPRVFSVPDVSRRIAEARRDLGSGQSAVLGLYAGGTLAHESVLILEPLLGPVASNLSGGEGHHRVLDLGADEFTVGRAHPMLDPTTRVDMIGRASEQADLAVLLLDVVLGHGAAADPAGDVAPALEATRAAARARGRGLAVVASVVGTARDPQGLAAQVARLEAAGAWVLPSNAQAARAAAAIAGGETVVTALLRPGARA
jgi:FdrA protein